jgi:hypothetical protein
MVQGPHKITDSANIYNDFINEELEDIADAIGPVHDQLRNVWGWWILEVTPQPVYYQDDSDNSDVIKHT